jgi:hypothetical protein
MPRYLLDMERTATPDPGATAVISRRFPEIAVEHRYTAHDLVGRELWVCRAPSAAHLERWAEASPFELRSLQQIYETHARAPHAPVPNTCGAARQEEP